MRKKVIQLPKEYLSYSQIQVWKHDKKRYKDLYFDNRQERRLENSGLEYGKIVADALEQEKDTGDVLTDAAMLLLPKYDVRDQEIRAEIKTKQGSFWIIGRPDTFNSATKAFREYKTGKGAWTQHKAQNHPQMLFYAMLIYLKHKVALTEAYLDWIETEDYTYHIDGYEFKGIRPTGLIKSFKIEFKLQDILSCMAETIKIAKEIELAWAAHVPVINS